MFLSLLARRRAPLLVLLLIFAVGVVGYETMDDPPGALQAWIAINVVGSTVPVGRWMRRLVTHCKATCSCSSAASGPLG